MAALGVPVGIAPASPAGGPGFDSRAGQVRAYYTRTYTHTQSVGTHSLAIGGSLSGGNNPLKGKKKALNPRSFVGGRPESGDDEYNTNQSESEDEVDSDFDIDEGEEPCSDQEEEPKRKRRIITKAYKVSSGLRLGVQLRDTSYWDCVLALGSGSHITHSLPLLLSRSLTHSTSLSRALTLSLRLSHTHTHTHTHTLCWDCSAGGVLRAVLQTLAQFYRVPTGTGESPEAKAKTQAPSGLLQRRESEGGERAGRATGRVRRV
uniref:Uncharacterized protein n=1 Tax=Callorhinchus milii TaxID=7868 RepID=A0A4W3GIP0_CALMI